MKKFSNELTDAEVERLAILAEEMGEAQQIIGKILRHGYESYNPVVDTGLTNRRMLEKELGHVQHAIERMSEARDVNDSGILDYSGAKRQSIEKWLHHQLSAAPLGRDRRRNERRTARLLLSALERPQFEGRILRLSLFEV